MFRSHSRHSPGHERHGFPEPADCCRGTHRLCSAQRAPVAQLDRALPSEGRGHKFESCRARQHSHTSANRVLGVPRSGAFQNFHFIDADLKAVKPPRRRRTTRPAAAERTKPQARPVRAYVGSPPGNLQRRGKSSIPRPSRFLIKIEPPQRLQVKFLPCKQTRSCLGPAGTPMRQSALLHRHEREEVSMGLGRAGLFWLLGVPIPIIILLMLFWR
jgi:hypothetical protein